MDGRSSPGLSKRVKIGKENFEEAVERWLEEINSDVSDLDSDSDYVESGHDTESEIEAEDEDTDNPATDVCENISCFYGKNRFKWSKDPAVPKHTRTLQHNIVVKCPGVRSHTAHAADPEEVWNLFFDNNILNIILRSTNAKIAKIRQRYKNGESMSDLRDLDLLELKSFLGLLILTSIFKSNHENIRSIFATDGSGRDIFRCVTNSNRFQVIVSCIRFDDLETRNERIKTDPLASISEVFKAFIANCQSIYCVGENVCVDEMLVAFRGRCKFKMYMPLKPAKYGLKIMALTDARTGYLFNAYIYCGKNSDGYDLSKEEKTYSKPTQAVLKLARPIYNTNRNITADNWFSSIELVNALKTKNLTYVGTLKKNKTEIPPSFLPSRPKKIYSSLHGFTSNLTLLSYVPKKSKVVLLISSMHHNQNNGVQTGKPEIIEFYNLTKGGVDSLDQKCSIYCCSSRRTRRWPMAIFYRLLDIASVNSFIAHQSYRDNKKMERYDFSKQLAMMLVQPEMKRRFQNTHLPREIRLSLQRILKMENPHHKVFQSSNAKRTTCRRCPASKERKTTHICVICKIPICLQCTDRICKECGT